MVRLDLSLWLAFGAMQEQINDLRTDLATLMELFKDPSPTKLKKRRAGITHCPRFSLLLPTRRALARRTVTGSAASSSTSPSEEEPASA